VPPPEGPQDAPEDLGDALAVAKVENICSTRAEAQSGQTTAPPSFPRINFSKTFPHFRQVYSKIGMRAQAYSLGFPSFSRPDGAGGCTFHVKRESPGMCGTTKNQIIKKTTKNANPSICFSINRCRHSA
jgi:hypothetical protein